MLNRCKLFVFVLLTVVHSKDFFSAKCFTCYDWCIYASAFRLVCAYCVDVCVCVRACVRVCERERETQRETQREGRNKQQNKSVEFKVK